MLPPPKDRPRGAGEQLGGRRARAPRQSWQVLAERNQCVAPVGIWVESAPQLEQSLAFASAFQVEEELKEQQREKAASLRRFQGEVKQRVNQQVRMRRKQQLQKSYEAAERERCVAMQYSDSALRSIPRKNTCLFRRHPTPAIGGPGAPTMPTQGQGVQSEPFQQQAAKLSKTVKQVRHRLASCKTMPQGAGPPELPGGVWRREKSEPCKTATVPAGDEGEELLLAGHHDLPAELQDQGTAPHQAEQDDGFYIKIQFENFCDGSVKDSSSPEPPQRLHTQYQAPLVLWTGVDQEETKKQRQNEYLRYRRLFMNIEREQVKEQQRQKERQKRIARIKSKKERQRRAEEERMQEMAEQLEPSPREGACETLSQLKLEERRLKKLKENQQRKKEYMRYIEALRAQMREKIKLYNIDLPPLCSCGSDFWDSHPDTCANNCVFYKNHKGCKRNSLLLTLLLCPVPQPTAALCSPSSPPATRRPAGPRPGCRSETWPPSTLARGSTCDEGSCVCRVPIMSPTPCVSVTIASGEQGCALCRLLLPVPLLRLHLSRLVPEQIAGL
ncbi:coiled-coil domain-containing protein 15 isoform X1 [Falco rusticolus]|uniref:coiled-coil domain-containing protein 15 isoform X1 n=1 Tax=Falco rusticolus TaxID=120794 RepID=UPI00188655D2|nr:coiled-coil domain-containing protein 15 isoform X1 [Falco rusticolus]XP_037265816.1 coiled-coil domain-containing protein 15 isoform X1 [Falco rusticolus]XP_037265817.1 coiled-coil domain-containing protein 15 isoform X1 [Falco rusticolus]